MHSVVERVARRNEFRELALAALLLGLLILSVL